MHAVPFRVGESCKPIVTASECCLILIPVELAAEIPPVAEASDQDVLYPVIVIE